MSKKKAFTVDVQMTVRITTQDIDDIMVSALEGGITYWCDEATVQGDYLGEYASDQISRGGILLLHDYEDDEWRKLDLGSFLKGVSAAISNGYYQEYDWFVDGKLDCCQIDGCVADAIIQCALFGETIYG